MTLSATIYFLKSLYQRNKFLRGNDLFRQSFVLFACYCVYSFTCTSCFINKPCLSFAVKRVDELGSIVAFHAEVGPHKSHHTSGQTINFETTRQNYGNAYFSHTGIFICPKFGLYFFMYTIMSYLDKYVQVKLVLNGSPVSYGTTGQAPSRLDIVTLSQF